MVNSAATRDRNVVARAGVDPDSASRDADVTSRPCAATPMNFPAGFLMEAERPDNPGTYRTDHAGRRHTGGTRSDPVPRAQGQRRDLRRARGPGNPHRVPDPGARAADRAARR